MSGGGPKIQEENPLLQNSMAISEEVLDEFPGMPHKAHRMTEIDDQRSFFKQSINQSNSRFDE